LKIAAAVVGLLLIGGGVYLVTSRRAPGAMPSEGSAMSGNETSVSGSSAFAELENFGSATGDVTAKVRYAYTSSGASGENGEMTQYWLARSDKWRTNSSFGGVTMISISDGATTYTCNGEEQTCYKMTAGSDAAGMTEGAEMMQPAEVGQEAENVQDTATVTRSSRTIAGRSATCFTVRSADGESSGFCYDDATKVLLSWEGTSGGMTTKMEAVEVTTDVTDADFEPPYPVQDLNAMLQGLTMPEGVQLPEGLELPDMGAAE